MVYKGEKMTFPESLQFPIEVKNAPKEEAINARREQKERERERARALGDEKESFDL